MCLQLNFVSNLYLFAVFFQVDGQYFPAASCLFDGKTTPHYRIAWQYIKDKLPDFKPEIGHSDFEEAENKAAEEETGMNLFALLNYSKERC